MVSPGDFAGLATVAVLGLSVLTLVSAVARRIGGPRSRRFGHDPVVNFPGSGASQGTVDELRDEVEQLRGELADMQAKLRQVDEIQERLDFAERMLAQVKSQGALPGAR
jgi:hypothetical protein